MEDTYAIEVDHISKHFKIFLDKGHELKDYVTSVRRAKYENRQVLKDISFKVKKGEAIGLIGQNGCGKSTTLKLLTKIMYPDSGSITMRGRVSSLIELGAGFHPDMSGRENIYINASIFGLSKKEIDRRLDDIIAFSELEEFIDNPVRTYSSGMYMRLAFAVAINVDADILLIDEILAVGDVNFQTKCFNRLREIKAEGTTIVIVSHSLGQIEQICERSIWIHDGVIRAEGKPRDIHPEYLSFMGEKREEIILKEKERQEEKEARKKREAETANTNESEAGQTAASETGAAEAQSPPDNVVETEDIKRWGNGDARIREIKLLDREGKEKHVFKTGESMAVQFDYSVKKTVVNAVLGIGIFRKDGIQCYGTNTRIDGVDEFNLEKSGKAVLNLDDVYLLPGVYSVDLAIEHGQGLPVDYFREAIRFEVVSEISDVGVVRIPHQWNWG